MVKKLFTLTFVLVLSLFFMPTPSGASVPSGVTLGEFRFFTEDFTKIAGSVSEVDDYLIFTKTAPNSVFFACFLLPGFNSTTEVGYAYNIQVTDIGTGLLYKYKSTAKGTADDVLIWQENITIKPYEPGTTIKAPAAPTVAEPSTTSTSEAAGELEVGFSGTKIEASDIDDTKCPADAVKNKDGELSYTKGLLAGVSCERATKTLEDALLIVKNIVTTLLLPIVGVLFTIMLLIGGILYISSRGNQTQADRGKKTLTAAIIGLLIVILSYTLISIFTNIIGGGIT